MSLHWSDIRTILRHFVPYYINQQSISSPRYRVPLMKPIFLAWSCNSRLYGIWTFVETFTGSHCWTLSRAGSNKPRISNYISFKYYPPINVQASKVVYFGVSEQTSDLCSSYLHMCTTCSTHFVLLGLIVLMKFGEECRLWALQHSVVSILIM